MRLAHTARPENRPSAALIMCAHLLAGRGLPLQSCRRLRKLRPVLAAVLGVDAGLLGCLHPLLRLLIAGSNGPCRLLPLLGVARRQQTWAHRPCKALLVVACARTCTCRVSTRVQSARSLL